MQFFCMQVLGIMFEDGMQAISPLPKEKQGSRRVTVLVKRVVGYLWVVLWLAWTTPGWTYPMMQRDRGGRILPFSILGGFLAA